MFAGTFPFFVNLFPTGGAAAPTNPSAETPMNIVLGEREEVALDSDDESEAETSKIHNESVSIDLD